MAETQWFWSGSAGENTITVKAKVDNSTSKASIEYSQDKNFSADLKTIISSDINIESGNIATFLVNGLRPNTTYYYRINLDGNISKESGSFRTIKVNKPYTFSIGCSGCAHGSLFDIKPSDGQVSNNKIFDFIHDQINPNLTFFIHLGDMHYRDIKDGDIEKYRKAYRDVFSQKRQRNLYKDLPIVYIWDDHDYSKNNSDGHYKGKYSASQVYRETVPHYPLTEDLDKNLNLGAIYHSFIVGRVRFIVTDARFHRNIDIIKDPDTGISTSSMLGNAQRDWLFRQLNEGKQNQKCIVWVNSVPWIDEATNKSDTWGGYATERKIIANFIQDNGITNLVMLSGDAHMLALDDGQNNKYSSSGGGSFPVIQAASLASLSSKKGGPYQFGPFPGKEQWGILTFTDNDGKISLNIQLKKNDEVAKIETNFTFV